MFEARFKGRRMDAGNDHRRRMAEAVQVDRLFKTYEIEVTPAEALSFAATAPAVGACQPAALYALIYAINQAVPPADFGPGHPRTGQPHHVFRVGRRHGERILTLEIFKGYLTRDFSVENMVENILHHGRISGSAMFEETDETLYRLSFQWRDS